MHKTCWALAEPTVTIIQAANKLELWDTAQLARAGEVLLVDALPSHQPAFTLSFWASSPLCVGMQL